MKSKSPKKNSDRKPLTSKSSSKQKDNSESKFSEKRSSKKTPDRLIACISGDQKMKSKSTRKKSNRKYSTSKSSPKQKDSKHQKSSEPKFSEKRSSKKKTPAKSITYISGDQKMKSKSPKKKSQELKIPNMEEIQFKASQHLLDPSRLIGYGDSSASGTNGITMEQFTKLMKEMTGQKSPSNAYVTTVIFSEHYLDGPLNKLIKNSKTKQIDIVIVPFFGGSNLNWIGHFTFGVFYLQGTKKVYFLDSKHQAPHELFTAFKDKMEEAFGQFNMVPEEECNALTHFQEDNIYCGTFAFKNVETIYFDGIPHLLEPFKIEHEFKRVQKILNNQYPEWPKTYQEKIRKMNVLIRFFYLNERGYSS